MSYKEGKFILCFAIRCFVYSDFAELFLMFRLYFVISIAQMNNSEIFIVISLFNRLFIIIKLKNLFTELIL